MKLRYFLFLSPLVVLGLQKNVQAEHVLYDFENSWQFEDWEYNQSDLTVEASEEFAVSGTTSARFYSPPKAIAPTFESRVWDNNWEDADRIAMNFINPTEEEQRIHVLVGSEVTGFAFEVTLPALSHIRQVTELQFSEAVRTHNINAITFTGQVNKEVLFYLDNISLLEEGEEPLDKPEEGEDRKPKKTFTITEDSGGLTTDLDVYRVEFAASKAEDLRAYFETLNLSSEDVVSFLNHELDGLVAEFAESESAEEQQAVLLKMKRLQMTADRFVEAESYLPEYSGDKGAGFVVGLADSMVKVMPKHLPAHLTMADSIELSLAGGEKEAFQVAVMPYEKPAERVTVELSELKGPGGAILDGAMTGVELVTYTETTYKTAPDVEYIGWWPDALMAKDEPIDVAMGDVQSWWVRLAAKRDQLPGEYTGQVIISSNGKKVMSYDVTVTVRAFNVPKHAPIPTALTFVDRNLDKVTAIGDETSFDENWNKIKFDYADKLAEYMINMDSIYRTPKKGRVDTIDWDIVEYLHDKGQLVSVCLGYFWGTSDETVELFRPHYEKAKELGVMDHVYIYGYDERNSDQYENINTFSEKFAKQFPEVDLIMTTSQDHSYGFDSVMKSLTGWCPIISRYNPTLAEEARKLGRQVWLYTCVWPPHPYPNIFTDYPNIDNRILSGMMLAKYKPDGYLYYHTAWWRTYGGITQYPYTDWNPTTFPGTNGDGAYFAIDEDANLLPTVRVENYRDGLEDLAYYMILQHQIKLNEQSDNPDEEWLKVARATLAANDDYVRTRIDWTKDPKEVRHYRTQLANAIESSPEKDTDPWKDGMGVLGIDWN
ncbi:glycoside hydrolase domain-containing protein [Cerasicoccus fimbriatus]|uniref:glycoside hydrolase domain-containing protein n=1 Tax=Cerasicoccus fimbriatus TaxID=3014554 RepID=UPI0022B47C8F|nr:glycoside hydrolase domain-containing protein [Cerasicoccus sp. TK19100]